MVILAGTPGAATPPVGVPTVDDVKAYLASVGGTSYTDDEVTDALDEEIALQISACGDRTGDYPPPLAGALKRRVARNLALRPMTLGYLTGGEVAQRVAGFDLEIRRKEAPYRKLVAG